MANRQQGVMRADPTLTPKFWQDLCGNPEPTSREKFLYLTIDEFSRVGPGGFSHALIARRLGVTVAMINHYFGSRNGLISEAAFMVYADYIEALNQAIQDAPKNPTARLEAWIRRQISFAVSVSGWAVVLNYPTLSLENPVEFAVLFRTRMSALFNVNMARLGQLILDLKSSTVSITEITVDNVDVDFYMSNVKLVSLASSVGMATLGAAVWAAGSHAPSAESPEAKKFGDYVLEEHVQNVVRLVQFSDLTG